MPRTRTGLIGLVAAVAAAIVVAPTAASAATSHVSPNLIRNAGAEKTGKPPTDEGAKVPLTGWTVAKKSHFTAVAYGAPEFPQPSDPGPKSRHKNFFAGGPKGTTNEASQRESLKPYASWIRSGKATFKLTGWLGGYSSQNDNCTVTLTWSNAKGSTVGSAKLGPVSAAARKDATGLLYRSTHGSVPKSASSVLVKIVMRRTDGVYDDGYADNLGLKLSRP